MASHDFFPLSHALQLIYLTSKGKWGFVSGPISSKVYKQLPFIQISTYSQN